MRQRCLLLLLGCVTVLGLTGCVGTVDGRHRFGVPLVKDRVERLYDRSPQVIWTAAKDVIKAGGVLTTEDVLRATLQGTVDTRNVWVKVEPVDTKVTRMIVEVRTKGGTADLDLAGEIDKQIALRLATGNLTPATKAAASPSGAR